MTHFLQVHRTWLSLSQAVLSLIKRQFRRGLRPLRHFGELVLFEACRNKEEEEEEEV